ncbi:hypothetical protein TEA_015381 [Camellia sinensis var. sinensis]|uniref:Oberon coiled-coil region domain-containing protein n=1 Tax=Camellia sinensis var. sinensis TaxID=542762 RepID=A0A4V3WP43_CAMSN|nr:hypothetical protein TEA_015381 [Camellia sinensis var. sinensis]
MIVRKHDNFFSFLLQSFLFLLLLTPQSKRKVNFAKKQKVGGKSLSSGVGLELNYCEKHDLEVSEDTEKNFAELLSEELKLRETEALESQQRADMALLEAKKITSQYQKEADKCNSGMETCEEAREKAEAVLLAQKRLTAMWESRARRRGWTSLFY